MSAPTTDEIAALLALPPAAREALATVAGPGWSIRGRAIWMDPPVPCHAPPRGLSFVRDAWLPASEAAILDTLGGRWTLDRDVSGDRLAGFAEHVASGSSARLAALRLVAAVYGGGA